MKLTNKPKTKTIVLSVICLAVMLLGVGASFAAYTSQDAQRGVVRNKANEVVRFTSNYLQPCANGTDAADYAGRTVLFGESDKNNDSLNIDIYVYNYVNGNRDMANQRDITYTMTIKITDGTVGTYAVKCGDQALTNNGNGVYVSGEMTLRGRVGNSHKYTVTIPGSALDQVKITATAQPTTLSVTNNQILAAVIAPCTAAETKTFTASGEFIDAASGAKPNQYEAFNYLISISSGKATATLTWDSSMLEIDKYFLEKIGKSNKDIIKTENEYSLIFDMNQPDGTGEYLIPFYMRNKEAILKIEEWPTMEKYITFKATQLQD